MYEMTEREFQKCASSIRANTPDFHLSKIQSIVCFVLNEVEVKTAMKKDGFIIKFKAGYYDGKSGFTAYLERAKVYNSQSEAVYYAKFLSGMPMYFGKPITIEEIKA